MFDFFRHHMRALQFLLVLLIFPSFIFFGIQGYSRFAGGDQQAVAKVDGEPISSGEFDNALRQRVDAARRQMPSIDAKMLDTPEMREAALDGLIRDRVMLRASDKLHLAVTDERMKRVFETDPEFAELRNPDGSVNQALLLSAGMTSETFAGRLRQDLARRQVTQGLTQSAFAAAGAASAALDAMYQQREVQVQRFESKDYFSKVAPTDAEIEQYYKNPINAARFQAPEEIAIEYVVLDLDTFKKSVNVPDEDVRKYYAENDKRYIVPEERQASHILIKADKDAPQAERDKAKAKAEGLLAQVRKSPADFATLAAKNSEDEGSARKGGDLGFFGRGAMVKPFEEAAFGLKPGETSGVVQSDFGYHIIKLVNARGGDKRSFDSVRPEIETELRNELAQKRFAEASKEFSDTVYEQADSLKPVAERWKLEIQKAEHVRHKAGAAKDTAALANANFLDALFSADALQNKHNTKAIDIGGSRLAAGRVLQRTAAHQLPLADVKASVREVLVKAQAAALAHKLGNERFAALQASPTMTMAETPVVISRGQTRELPRELIDAVLKVPSNKLPVVVNVDLRELGFALARVNKLLGRDPLAGDPEKAKSQYSLVWADAELKAYYEALRSRYKVSVSSSALTPSPDPAASEGR